MLSEVKHPGIAQNVYAGYGTLHPQPRFFVTRCSAQNDKSQTALRRIIQFYRIFLPGHGSGFDDVVAKSVKELLVHFVLLAERFLLLRVIL